MLPVWKSLQSRTSKRSCICHGLPAQAGPCISDWERMSQVWGTAGCWYLSDPSTAPSKAVWGLQQLWTPSGSQLSLWLCESPLREGWGTPQNQCASKPSFCPVERTVPFSLGQKRTKPATSSKKAEAAGQGQDAPSGSKAQVSEPDPPGAGAWLGPSLSKPHRHLRNGHKKPHFPGQKDIHRRLCTVSRIFLWWENSSYGWPRWEDDGVGGGEGSLGRSSPWGRKESDTAEQLNWMMGRRILEK